VPRNRQQIPREERVTAFVEVALELFEQRDFEDVTLAEIARRTGVQNAAVYWYFASKDHLLAAVVDRVRELSIERFAARSQDVPAAERLVLHLQELKPTRPVHASAHARARLSPAVAAAHDALMAHVRVLVLDAVQDHAPDDRAMLTELIVALFEGANDPSHHGPSATELIAFTLERLAGPPQRTRSRSAPA
jgi:TetR/AcrR family transcriptional repressor of mexAB-oprM operon